MQPDRAALFGRPVPAGAAGEADAASGAALRDCLDERRAIGARYMQRRRAIRPWEILGIDQRQPGTVANTEHDQRAMRALPADLLEFAGIDCPRRQFGDP